MYLPSNATTVRTEGLGYNWDDGGAETYASVVAGGDNTTKGAWVSVGTPSMAYESILIMGYGRTNSQSNSNILDIGCGSSGNQAVMAQDLVCGCVGANYTDVLYYTLPLHVPSGQQLWARWQSNTASRTIAVGIVGFSHGMGDLPGYARCVALHNATTNNGGHRVDCGNTANAFGSWVEINASTSSHISALMGVLDRGASNTSAAQRWVVQIAIGAAGSEAPVMQMMAGKGYISTTFTDTGNEQHGPIPISIPAGTRLSARGMTTTSSSGQKSPGVSLYGFV